MGGQEKKELLFPFDNTVIGLDISLLRKLFIEDVSPSLGIFLRLGRNNFYNHTEYTIGENMNFIKL